MACMDDLAEDTLHYEIMPYLNYEERINFNQSLRPLHRRNKKFTKKQLLEHSFSIIALEYRVKLNLYEYYNISEGIKDKKKDEKIIELLYKIFLFCVDEKVAKFIKLFPTLHKAMIGRCIIFKDVTYYIGRNCTKEQEENFIQTSTKLYDLLTSDINMKDYYKLLKCEVIGEKNLNSILESLI